MQHQHLHTALSRVQDLHQSNRLPVVVFDLDSTLFATAGRNKVILERFAAAYGGGNSDLKTLVADISFEDLGWDIRTPLRARGVTDEGLLAALLDFWKDRFFTDEFVLFDHPNPGAVDYVRRIHEAGALVYYLTGRHIQGMSLGTVQALTQAPFPYWRGRAILHLKPNFSMDDAEYKQQAISDIRSHQGVVVATFDNEPANCNIFQRAFPDALNFFVDTEHSPDAEPLDSALISIQDFRLTD